MSSAPDFSRDVVAVLGLPFDVLGLDAASARIRTAALARRRCFFSTPNLNFAIACRADAAFRASVLASDLSLADGMPIVWAARALGLALPERVAGSSVFERLRDGPPPRLRTYFFGGPEGAAQAACERIEATASGLAGAGALTPGFGSVASMSDAATIDAINAAQPQLLVVALGASKGQAWILRNREQLDAPVISHLGAVVNFAAGQVRRAPPWVQRAQLEWLWRIKEEPALWQRYARDGWALLRVAATELLPLALRRLWRKSRSAAHLEESELKGHPVLRLTGAWQPRHAQALRERLAYWAAQGIAPAIDLAAADALDGATLGTLMLLYGWCAQGDQRPWRISPPAGGALRDLRQHGAAFLLDRPARSVA